MNNFYSISLDGRNYSLKYSDSNYQTVIDQFKFFEKSGFNLGNKFIFMRVAHGNFALEIDSENKSMYNHYSRDFETKCPSADALFTREEGITLCGLWSDCPHIVIKSKGLVGLIHASRACLDKKIIESFVNETKIKPNDTQIIIANSISEKDFDHDYLGFKRAYEWLAKNHCKERNGSYYLDLPAIIQDDFKTLGFTNLESNPIDVVEYSEMKKELHGVVYSHRLSKKYDTYKEGRGLIAVSLERTID